MTEYDTLGRVITSTRNALPGAPDPTQYNITTSYTYDQQGRQVAVTDPLGMVSRTYYDALGRAFSSVRKLSRQYLEDGTPRPAGLSETNLRNETIYAGDGRVTAFANEAGNITQYGYDALGRQTEVTDPLNHTTASAYDGLGRLVSRSDANGIVTRFEYDNLGRLKAVVENYQAGAQPDSSTNVRTEYTFDANGNRLGIKDGNSHITTFTYDALGRLKSEQDPLGNTWVYGYDKAGNRVSLTDANGKTTNYTYDDLNRLVFIDYPSTGSGQSPSPDADVTFTYDAAGRRLSMTDEIGRAHV